MQLTPKNYDKDFVVIVVVKITKYLNQLDQDYLHNFIYSKCFSFFHRLKPCRDIKAFGVEQKF